MAHTLVAKTITHINPFTFETENDQIVSLIISTTVAYDGVELTHLVNIWPLLTPARKQQIQNFYNQVFQHLQQHFLT